MSIKQVFGRSNGAQTGARHVAPSPSVVAPSADAPWPPLETTSAAMVEPAFEQILRDSPDCEAWLDAEGTVRWVNGAAQRVTGYSPDECLVLEDFPACLVWQVDRARFEALRLGLPDTHQASQGHVRLCSKDGTITWVSVCWQPLLGAHGQRLGTRVSLRDSVVSERYASSQRVHLLAFRREAGRITREACAQADANDFAALCRHVVAQAAQTLAVTRASVWLFSPSGAQLDCVCLYLSERQQFADSAPISVTDFPHYVAAIARDELIVATHACTHTFTRELAESYLRPLGIASMLDAPIQQSGRTVGVLCMEHGPVQRHWSAGEAAFADALAEMLGLQLESLERQALHTHSERLASIIETTPDLVFTVTLAGQLTYLNRAGRQLMGVGPDEPIEHFNAMNFVPPELQERRRNEILPHTLKHGRWSGEVVALSQAGERIPIWEDLLAHRGPDGRVQYLSAVVRDLREQKRGENTLRQREQALQRLNDELEARVQERTRKIEEVNRNLETFAFSVSHDLKAPLRGIDGYSRLLQEDFHDRLSAEGQQFIGHIRQAAQSMSQLIDDLLAYSRVGRRELSRTQFDISSAVQRVLTERAHDLSAHGVTIVNEVASLALHADLECFLQIVRNLVDNAVKFSQHSCHPEVTLRTQDQGERLIFSVKDNGCGFDMKYHERIFSIFQRLHRQDDYPGTGVGLAIVSKAAERLGGRVWAHSQPGEGAEFFLDLPVSTKD